MLNLETLLNVCLKFCYRIPMAQLGIITRALLADDKVFHLHR